MLGVKDFDEKKITIEVPEDTTRGNADAKTDVDDDEAITDSKALYRRFVSDVETQQLTILKATNPGKKSGSNNKEAE